MESQRCIVCNKKVKIHVIACRCKQYLCGVHVSPECHECSFDYKEYGRRLLEKQNPKIIPEKIKVN